MGARICTGGVCSNPAAFNRRALAIAAAVALGGLLAASASAQTVLAIWTDAAGDNLWNDAGNWSPAGVPNNGNNGSDYDAEINTPAACDLSGSATVDELLMTSNATLNLLGPASTLYAEEIQSAGLVYSSGSCTLEGFGSSIFMNNGAVEAPNAPLTLNFNQITQSAGGQIVCVSASVYLENCNVDGGALTGEDVAGAAIQIVGSVALDNITSTAPVVLSGGSTLTLQGNISNGDVINATAGNAIIANSTITQGGGTLFQTSSGTAVSFTNSNISGGALSGAGVWTVSGTSALSNLTSSATFYIPDGNELEINGNITDNGLIVVNSNGVTGGNPVGELNFNGGSIGGTGTIQLQAGGPYAQIVGSLTQAAGHTIDGFGTIYASLTNNGFVDANVTGQALVLFGSNSVNNGLLQASNGGILTVISGLTNFSGTTLTGGSYEVDANSTINITGSIVNNAANITLGGADTSFAALASLANNSGSFTIANTAAFSTAGSFTNSGTLTTAGTGSLTINGDFDQTAGQTIDNGQLSVTGSTTIAGGTVTVGPSDLFIGSPITVDAAGQLVANGSLVGAPNLTDDGIVVFEANSGGGLRARMLSSMTVGNGGVATIDDSSASANRTLMLISTLSIAGSTNAWTGKFDVGNNDLDIAGGVSLATITNQIKQGYNGGNWQGNGGITSSAAASDTTHLTALGVIQNNQGGSPLFNADNLFDGTVPGASDILVKYTYYGDANLDGRVDASDYSLIDNGYLNHLSGWYNGDFNYDGVINGSDYTLIDNAFNMQGAQLSDSVASPGAIATASIAARGTSAVPEPASAGILGVLGMRHLFRREARRR